MKLESIMWLLPIVFMLHEFEEILMLPAWLAKNLPDLRRRFPRLAAGIERRAGGLPTPAFALAVAEEFVLISLLTWAAVEGAYISLWTGMLLAFLAHLVLHIGQFLALRRYVPVAATSLPALGYGVWAVWSLSGRGLLDWGAVWAWAGVFTLVMLGNLALALRLGRQFDRWLARSFV